MGTAPEDAIRARRRLTNKLIAAHEAPRLRPFFAPDVKLIVGDGSLILGADAVVQAFAGQFTDPAFKTYVRETTGVEIDADARVGDQQKPVVVAPAARQRNGQQQENCNGLRSDDHAFAFVMSLG